MSPTSRSLNHLRKAGYLAEVVERFNSFTKRRSDLFGFIDLVAVGNGHTLGIQTTTADHLSARINKIRTECRETALAWVQAGNRIILHGWQKRAAKPGSKALRWTVKERELREDDLAN
jgi:hypothetical protein